MQTLLHVKRNWVRTWLSKYSKDRKIQDSGLLIKPPYKVTVGDYNSELLKYTDRLFTSLHILFPFAFNAHETMIKVMSLWTHACTGKHIYLKDETKKKS